MIALAAFTTASAFAEPPDSTRVADTTTTATVSVETAPPVDSVPPTPLPPYVIRIDSVTTDGGKLADTVDIFIDAYGSGIAAFSLKIATDYYGLDIIEILPGEFTTACKWKMFSPRELTLRSGSSAPGPAELWQITALANIDPNADTAVCYELDHPATLARLVVMMSGFSSEIAAPIFFYWESCRDNLVSDLAGASIIISDSVVDRLPITLATERNAFPTRYGTPDECVSTRARVAPQRRVVFINGGIEYRAMWGDSTMADSAADTTR